MQSIYVDSNEKQEAVLGGGYLQNFISSGSVGKGFCEVTDKRVYFKGKCLYKAGNTYKSSKEERIVDLKDVTGTGFSRIKSFTTFVLMLVSFAWAIFLFIMTGIAGINEESIMLMLVSAISPAVIFVTVYLMYNIRIFEISFAGGKIAFKASNYSEAEIQQFQKDLRLAKDRYESASFVAQSTNSSNAEELKKYKELLDSGVISVEEFEQTKKKLLGL